MTTNSSGEGDSAERWDQLYGVLSAEPRRMIIYSLLEEPGKQCLPLPDAANSPNMSMDAETLSIELRHHHLPILADAGHVRWEQEPFCVQRGPHFEEPAVVVDTVVRSVNDLPQRLVDDCRALQVSVDENAN